MESLLFLNDSYLSMHLIYHVDYEYIGIHTNTYFRSIVEPNLSPKVGEKTYSIQSRDTHNKEIT